MGAWRTSLFIQIVENSWVGPSARVTRIKNRYIGIVYRDDTLRFCGRITGKETSADGSMDVELEIWNDVGHGPPVTTGQMSIRIPEAQ